MPKAWSSKRERQYEHIKQGYERQGKPEPVAEEIAARTVNKERAQHGEAREASEPAVRDMPAPRRGGQRSHAGAQGRTRDQLYEEARRKKIPGRSAMDKAALERAVGKG